ncbi:HNH endonuclease [Rhodobacter sp. JA431]|uniref:HNH endonuclease n=1 Tax=Rhodobacter sp. JA431 TaxID=570013 RepID=UPI000BE46B44|nr:HNH endonuclease signature motif containing protein [Rhodobacter sp. JA431]
MSKRKEYARHSKRVTSTRRWQVLRQQILERDGWACRCCGERRRLEVDHIQPVRLRPDLAFDPRNLQALCPRCHTRKTRIECGHKPKSPARKAWDAAVADLAAETLPLNEGNDPCLKA